MTFVSTQNVKSKNFVTYGLFSTKVNKNMRKYIKKIQLEDKEINTVMDKQGNSDPIASSATQDDPPEEEEDDHFGVVLYNEPSDEEPKAKRKSSMKKKRTHKYKSSWEQIDSFKEWIQPSDKPEFLAFCLVCNAYLKGASGRNDITKHSKTEVHLKNSRKATDVKPHPSKKRKSNADSIGTLDTPSMNLKQEEAHEQESEFEFYGIESIDGEYTPTDKKSAKRRNQPIMYNPSWEKSSAFREWIRPSDKPDYVAYCSLCKVYIKGSSGKNDITKHSLTEVHLRHVKRDDETDVDAPIPTPKMTCPLRKKFVKLETKKNGEPELVKKCTSFIKTSRDDSQIFGDYVASALRDLTDDRNKKRLKIMIQKSIIEVQETDGETVGDIAQRTYCSNIYTPVTSMSCEASRQVASTEEVTTVDTSIGSTSNGVLPVQVEAAQGQYRYNLLC